MTSTHATETTLAARPDEVHTTADLVLHLDRLRRSAARGTGQRRVGLDRLAKATGVPRSTLHTYLSGATLPPASILDSLVIALGCDADELAAWARAWERVAEGSQGSRARSGLSPNSKLASLCTDVRRRLDRPTDSAYDVVEPVALFERVWLGPTRAIDAVDVRATVRAIGEHADRFPVRVHPRDGVAVDRLTLTDLVNCRAGQHRTLSSPRVRVLEAVFDHPLRRGETCTIEFRIDYAGTAIPGSPAAAATETMRGFLRRGPVYTMETRFRAGDLPRDVRQVQLTDPDGPENVVRPLALNEWHAAHIVLERPSPGLHGIRWTWR